MKNIFYCPHLNVIGGIETFLFEIALKYGETHDITILYKTGSPLQLERYMKLVRCLKWDEHTRFKCNKLFTGYTTDIAEFVDYEELYIIIHADFEKQRLSFPPTVPKDAKYLCVSEALRERNEEWLKQKLTTAYNPIVIPDSGKCLHLITASRLTPEKGKHRMEKLAKALRSAKIPFLWTVFTDDGVKIDDDSVVYLPPTMDILPYIRGADYLVQLSDTEAYSYSILEALCVGTPVIITPLPLVEDMQIRDGENGFILPFDMEDIPVERIAKGLPPFSYTPKPDPYGELLAGGKPDYVRDKDKIVTVTHRINYFDIELNCMCLVGQTHETNLARAMMLEAKEFVYISGDCDDTSVG